MAKQKYVVKFNPETPAYLKGWTGELSYANCQWSTDAEAMEFDTLAEAQDIATRINSGTVGLPRPH